MRIQGIQAWALGSAGLMLIGAFGPWAKVLGASTGGTDGHNDGWFLAGFAAIAALLAFARRTSQATGLWLLILGLAGSATTIYDRNQISSAISQAGALGQALAQIGWGLNLGMIASISLTIAGITWLIKGAPTADAAEQAPSQPLPPAASPITPAAGWYKDPQDPLMLRYWTGSGWTTQTAKPTG